MARLRPLLFAGLLLVAGAATAAGDDLACNQDPRDRFFWLERAFCDLEMAGPQRAQGLIIWNHGIFGTTESWKAPAPPVLRIAQVRGWDVIVIKRHHLAETMPGGPLDRTVKRTLEEASARRQAGYAKRDLPWLMIDETVDEIRGHGGAVTGRFALRYGHCLSEFLAVPALPVGRFSCPPDRNEARVVRELLLHGKHVPNFAVDPARVPPALHGLLGARWALIGDFVALVGAVEDQGKLKLMYRTGPSGGIWDATTGESGISAVLRNRATVHLSSEANGTVVWTAEDKSRTLKGVLIRLDDLQPPQPSR